MMKLCLMEFFSLAFILQSRIVNAELNSTVESISSLLPARKYNGSKLNQILLNYDRKIRPNTYGPATNVQIEVKVVDFGPIEESQQYYVLDMFFRQWWNDPKLKGAVSESLTMAIDPAALIWKPDTYFVNARDSEFQYVTKETMRFIIKPNGDVYYSARINLKVNCQMRFDLYPMDTQMCPLYIESCLSIYLRISEISGGVCNVIFQYCQPHADPYYTLCPGPQCVCEVAIFDNYSYTRQEVFYTWHESAGHLRKTKGVEWIATNGPIFKLVDVTSTQTGLNNNSKGNFSKLQIMFHLARRQGYFLWHIYIPGALLVIMTWVNFWLPASAYPARVTVSVTSFLSTMLVMSTTNDKIARVSYVKALDYFLMGNATFVFLTLMEYVIVLHATRKLTFKFWQRRKKKKMLHPDSSRENMAFSMDRHSRDQTNGIIKHDEKYSEKQDVSASISDFNYQFSGRMDLHRSNKNSHVMSIWNERDGHNSRPSRISREIEDFWYDRDAESHILDTICRTVFPVLYSVFIISYFLYYKSKY